MAAGSGSSRLSVSSNSTSCSLVSMTSLRRLSARSRIVRVLGMNLLCSRDARRLVVLHLHGVSGRVLISVQGKIVEARGPTDFGESLKRSYRVLIVTD